MNKTRHAQQIIQINYCKTEDIIYIIVARYNLHNAS